MTYQTYKRTLILVGIFYLLIFLLDIFGGYFIPEGGASSLPVVYFFAYRILSLFLLFFSIYARISGVMGIRKLEAPTIFIVFGAILVISSFGPPILFGYLTPNTIKDRHEYIQPQQIKKQAMDINIPLATRIITARKYYIETGEPIPYIDSGNLQKIYIPDQ